MKRPRILTFLLVLGCMIAAPRSSLAQARASGRNIIIFVADGMRAGSINSQNTPALLSVRNNGVYFSNSHALFPTFTTANGSAIATGHQLGDTGVLRRQVVGLLPNTNSVFDV